jgi:carbonyl reductase 1
MSSAAKEQQRRVILVTGANKGIGFAVVKKLVEQCPTEETIILLACRDLQRGQDALVQLGSPGHVHLLQLDMSSMESILRGVAQIKEKYADDHLDVVINNAAITNKEVHVQSAREIFATNYYGIKLLNEQLAPLMRDHGRIINVSSQLGPMVLQQVSSALQEQYTSPTLKIEQLDHLIEELISGIESDTLDNLGYHVKTHPLLYGLSKAALNALSQIEARQWSPTKHLLVLSVSPGFCATDMTQNAATARSAELGALSILHGINTSPDELVNGGFYRDGEQLPLVCV